MEPWGICTVCNFGEPGSRFPAAAPNHPKLYWQDPKLFKLLRKNLNPYLKATGAFH